MKLRAKLVMLVTSMFLLSLAGCGKSKPYSTSCSKTEIGKVKKEKLCVISFSSDPDVWVRGGSILTWVIRAIAERKEWEKSISDKLNKSYFEKLITHLQKDFAVIVSDYESVKDQIEITDKTKIVDAIARTNAEIGLVVHSNFGWQWSPADAGISYYDVTTHVSLVNKKGDLIWDFNSRATIIPPLFSVEGALSGITATTPSDNKIMTDYAEFFQYYPAVVTGLIEEDINGKQHGSKLYDYITKKNQKSKIILYQK